MSELLDKALKFAIDRHSGQMRKAANTPYILHPMEVAAIIASITDDEATMAAGALHDTVEDTDTTPEEIRDNFGSRVSALVACETEDKLIDRPAEDTWLERKQDTLMLLESTRDKSVKIMWLADKLSNIRSMYRSYLIEGDAMWQHFHQKDPKMHEWYYRCVAEYTKEHLGETSAYEEFVELIDKLFSHYSDNSGK